MAKAFTFSESAAKRIGAVVRRVEGSGEGVGPPATGTSTGPSAELPWLKTVSSSPYEDPGGARNCNQYSVTAFLSPLHTTQLAPGPGKALNTWELPNTSVLQAAYPIASPGTAQCGDITGTEKLPSGQWFKAVGRVKHPTSGVWYWLITHRNDPIVKMEGA